MKKKLLLLTLLLVALTCIFAISVSAETALKPQDTNAYGELSFFDESITVGRTDAKYGFTPFMTDGTTYARVVIGDGTTFYTFPTAYMLSNSKLYGDGNRSILVPDFTSLNSAMETVTGTNPNWSKTNVYRIEMPATMNLFNGGEQGFASFSNVIEIRLQPNSSIKDSNKSMMFYNCYELETIHNLDTFVFRNGCLGGAFQSCAKLTSLTIGYSPEVTKTDDSTFYGCTSLVSVNFNEAFPNITSIGGKNTFCDCNALKSLSSERNDGVVVLSSKITYFGTDSFKNCDSIKAIKFTSSSTKALQQAFHSMDSLEFVSFPRNSKLELPSCEVFSNNENLKAVAFPDDCTVIPDRGFKNCKGLYAVYLPANLYNIMTNGGGQGAFAYNDDMYFVQDWFDVLDENGEFLFDKFVQPTRPDVYYFPSTLTLLYKRDGGTGFDGNYNLNPVMVLPETVTELWVYDGCFYNCGTADNQKTIVMLGDMVNVRFNMRDSRTVGINYVFANSLDQDLTSVNIVDTTDRTCYNVTNETIYFCSTGKTYALSQWEAHPDPATFEFTTEDKHLYVIEKNTAPTCTVDGVKGFVCFCGAASTESEVIKAKGHTASDIIKNKFFTKNEDGSYNYFANMIKVCDCTACDATDVEFDYEGTALFATDKGYSFSETDASSFSYTLHVNVDAIKAYLAENAGFKYGVVVSANTANNPISIVEGAVNKEVAQTIIVELQGSTNVYEYVMTKLTFDADNQGKSLICQAYAVDGADNKVSYLGPDKTTINAEVISHAILVEKYESKEDLANPAA